VRKPEDSLYPPDWLKVAEKDWRRMKIMLDNEDAEAAGYFPQQSVEKYIKAFLLERDWELKKIHELDALLDEAVKYDLNLESFRDLCERVSEYYFMERYPALVDTGLTCEDIEKDIDEARKLIKALSSESL
jgi:HEPN domain-containing protein